MSTLDAGGTRLSADDRYELATRAQSQQRLNSPKHLIVLAMMLLFVSLIVLVVAWRSQSSAMEENQITAQNLARIESLISEINTLRASQNSSTDVDIFQPMPDILSRLQNLAQRAELKNDLGLPRNPATRPVDNAIYKTYPYTVRDPKLENVLNWIKLTQEEIPGLQVNDLSIQPGTQFWTTEVLLVRYERQP